MSPSFTRASTVAEKIISELHITEPSQIDIECIATERGAFVRERPTKGCAARLVNKGSIGLITVNSEIREPGKKRFAVAHELGHFELHRAQETIALCTEDSFMEWYTRTPNEPEANTFAAELLMPSEMFKPACKGVEPNFEEIASLAGGFKTTLTATAIRYVDVGPHPCVLIASRDGVVSWFHSRPDFPYRVIKPGDKLSELSCANDFFTNGTVPGKPEEVRGDAWLENWKNGLNIVLYEHAKALTSYNTVLSLLWLCQDLNLRY